MNQGANREAFAGTVIQHGAVELNNSKALIAWGNSTGRNSSNSDEGTWLIGRCCPDGTIHWDTEASHKKW